MNERIQELYDSIVGNDKLNFDSYLAEKFAESLIRQCMDLVTDCYAEPGLSLYQSVCASTIIEEHFGVKE